MPADIFQSEGEVDGCRVLIFTRHRHLTYQEELGAVAFFLKEDRGRTIKPGVSIELHYEHLDERQFSAFELLVA